MQLVDERSELLVEICDTVVIGVDGKRQAGG